MKIVVKCWTATPKGNYSNRNLTTRFWEKEFSDECEATRWAQKQFEKDAATIKVEKRNA